LRFPRQPSPSQNQKILIMLLGQLRLSVKGSSS